MMQERESRKTLIRLSYLIFYLCYILYNYRLLSTIFVRFSRRSDIHIAGNEECEIFVQRFQELQIIC